MKKYLLPLLTEEILLAASLIFLYQRYAGRFRNTDVLMAAFVIFSSGIHLAKLIFIIRDLTARKINARKGMLIVIHISAILLAVYIFYLAVTVFASASGMTANIITRLIISASAVIYSVLDSYIQHLWKYLLTSSKRKRIGK